MMRVGKFRIFSVCTLLLVCLFLTCTAAFAVANSAQAESSVQITEVSTDIGDNYIRYPQLVGMENLSVQQSINDAIVDEANIVQRLITLSTLQPGGAGLQVSYAAYLNDALFSTVISAKGAIETLRSTHQYTALSFDLLTGTKLALSDFFSDSGAAVAWMEDQLLSGYADELSNYLVNASVTPLPADNFSFDRNGLTFYYPYRQFALLSGYSGAVQFQYGELQAYLDTAPDSVPSRLRALLPPYTDAQIREQIEAAVSQGSLPYIPAALGDKLPALIEKYSLSRTPDQYPGGRYFQFEAPAFRQVLILSDALTSGYDASVVEGILATRMNLFGIQTGVTPQSRWRAILGEPTASVALDSSLAADYGLPVGTADYYTVADRQLMLYADENDVLYAVRLAK